MQTARDKRKFLRQKIRVGSLRMIRRYPLPAVTFIQVAEPFLVNKILHERPVKTAARTAGALSFPQAITRGQRLHFTLRFRRARESIKRVDRKSIGRVAD